MVWLSCAAAPSAATERPGPLRIVTFGTSLSAYGGWQDDLRRTIGRCTDRPVEIAIHAKGGASSRWGVTQVDAVLALQPDIVTVEFAMNDAALNRFLPLSWSVANLREIGRRLKSSPHQPRVVVMAMNPVHGLRGALRPVLDAYENAHAALAAQAGLSFVDNRPAWRALPPGRLRDAIPDGIHPVGVTGKAIIAENLRKALFPDCAV
jgi:acyl-CoA thioesterase-1